MNVAVLFQTSVLLQVKDLIVQATSGNSDHSRPIALPLGSLLKNALNTNFPTSKPLTDSERFTRVKPNNFNRKKCKYKVSSEAVTFGILPVENILETVSEMLLLKNANFQSSGKDEGKYWPLESSIKADNITSSKTIYAKLKKCKEKTYVAGYDSGNNEKKTRSILSARRLTQRETHLITNSLVSSNREGNRKIIDGMKDGTAFKNLETADFRNRKENFSKRKFKKPVKRTLKRKENLLRRESNYDINGDSNPKSGYHRKKCKVKPTLKDYHEQPLTKMLKTKEGNILLKVLIRNDKLLNTKNHVLNNGSEGPNMLIDVNSARRLQLTGNRETTDDPGFDQSPKTKIKSKESELIITINGKQENSQNRKKCKNRYNQQIALHPFGAESPPRFDEFDLLFNDQTANEKRLNSKHGKKNNLGKLVRKRARIF